MKTKQLQKITKKLTTNLLIFVLVLSTFATTGNIKSGEVKGAPTQVPISNTAPSTGIVLDPTGSVVTSSGSGSKTTNNVIISHPPSDGWKYGSFTQYDPYREYLYVYALKPTATKEYVGSYVTNYNTYPKVLPLDLSDYDLIGSKSSDYEYVIRYSGLKYISYSDEEYYATKEESYSHNTVVVLPKKYQKVLVVKFQFYTGEYSNNPTVNAPSFSNLVGHTNVRYDCIDITDPSGSGSGASLEEIENLIKDYTKGLITATELQTKLDLLKSQLTTENTVLTNKITALQTALNSQTVDLTNKLNALQAELNNLKSPPIVNATITKSISTPASSVNLTLTSSIGTPNPNGITVKRIVNPNGTYTNSSTSTQTVTENGTHTFFVETSDGRQTPKSIEVTNIASKPTLNVTANRNSSSPEPVTFTVTATSKEGIPTITLPDGTTQTTNYTTYTVTSNATGLVFKANSPLSNSATYTETVSKSVNCITPTTSLLTLKLDITPSDKHYSTNPLTGNNILKLNYSAKSNYSQDSTGVNAKFYLGGLSTPAKLLYSTTIPIDYANETTGTLQFDLSTLGSLNDGIGNLYYTTTDFNGNMSFSQNYLIPICSTPTVPTVTLTPNPLQTEYALKIVTNPASSAVPIKEIAYYVSPLPTATHNPDTWKTISNNFSTNLNNLNGNYYVHVYTKDYANNTNVVTSPVITVKSSVLTRLTNTDIPIYTSTSPSTSGKYLLLTNKDTSNLNVSYTLEGNNFSEIPNAQYDLLDSNFNRVASTQGRSSYLTSNFTKTNLNTFDISNYTTQITIDGSPIPISDMTDKTNIKLATISNPIQSIFNIDLTDNLSDPSKSDLKLSVKYALDTVTSNGIALGDLLNSSDPNFSGTNYGIDLLADLKVDIGENASVSNATAIKPYNSATNSFTTLTGNPTDKVAIGYTNANGQAYEFKSTLSNLLGNVELLNISDKVVMSPSPFDIKAKITHKGSSFIAPTSSPEYSTYNIETLIIPRTNPNVPTFVATGTLEDIWLSASTSNPSFLGDISTNNQVTATGKYDILVKTTTATGSTCYDYKILEYINTSTENFLALTGNETYSVSKSYIRNNLTNKIVRHNLNVSSAGDLDGLKLANGDLLVHAKTPQLNTEPKLSIFDSDLTFLKEMFTSDFEYVNSAKNHATHILLGTNRGLFHVQLDYNSFTNILIPSGNSEVYTLQEYKSSILLGTSNSDNTLLQLNYLNSSWDTIGKKTSMELFNSSSNYVRTIMINSSGIYVSSNLGDSTSPTDFIVLQ